MISIKRYSEDYKNEWDSFNTKTKNNLFMFNRDYMDYHRDRFVDHSLLFYNDDKLFALFPACERGGILWSHGGLTYGGFLTDSNMKQHSMLDCFEALINHAKNAGLKSIVYKAIPHIYHSQPAEEDRFALYVFGARLVRVDASTYVNLKRRLRMPKGRKAQISRANREGIRVEELMEETDYEAFINMENEILKTRHNTHAVHSAKELKMLHDQFPDNIHLFGAKKNDRLIAGTVIFEYEDVIHTQYMAANNEARQMGALDLTISRVMDFYADNKVWLDFGISTERDRLYLNKGLISQKEGFGGRTGVYETWEISI